MAQMERFGNEYDLDRWLPNRCPLRELSGCVFSVGREGLFWYLVFDERKASYPASDTGQASPNEKPVTVLNYMDLAE